MSTKSRETPEQFEKRVALVELIAPVTQNKLKSDCNQCLFAFQLSTSFPTHYCIKYKKHYNARSGIPIQCKYYRPKN